LDFALDHGRRERNFLNAETKRQKSPFKPANVGRDQNPGNEWPEIPAETQNIPAAPGTDFDGAP